MKSTLVKPVAIAAGLLVATAHASGQEIILPDLHADPSTRVFDEKFYIPFP